MEVTEAELVLLLSVASAAGCGVMSAACEDSSAGGGEEIAASVRSCPFSTTDLAWTGVGSNVGDCDARAGVVPVIGWAIVGVWGVGGPSAVVTGVALLWMSEISWICSLDLPVATCCGSRVALGCIGI